MSDKTGTFDSAKLASGLNMVFRGYAMIFDAMAEQAELLETAAQGTAPIVPAEQPDSNTQPWEDAPETAVEQAEPKKQMTKQEFLYTIQSKVTDLTARIPADKVKALLNKHGASSLSALPPEKYEAFLYDFNRL
ncbi:MAG: hypothetical protein ACI3X2_11625 [Butyricicoccus porcorum]